MTAYSAIDGQMHAGYYRVAQGLGFKVAAGAGEEETAAYVIYCNEDTMDRLLAGQALQAGGFLESPNGWMRLILQNDGDVVLRRVQLNKGVSVSHSDGDPVTQLTMQIDGDLVASGGNRNTALALWHRWKPRGFRYSSRRWFVRDL